MKPKTPKRRRDLVGKTIAKIDWPEDDFPETEVTIKFTDGTEWEIGTCSCCGLSDKVTAKEKQ